MEQNKTVTLNSLHSWHQGDEKGLDELVKRHLPWIREKVHWRLSDFLRSKGETLDYVQDAMVEFLRYGPRFTITKDEDFRRLLLKIVENSLRNKYDWYTARRRDLARERPLPSDTILYLDLPLDRVSTPSKSAERHEGEAWVRLGMELIDPHYREVLILRQWDKLPFKTIGEQLGISSDAARMKHRRALIQLGEKVQAMRSGKLREALQESDEGGEIHDAPES